MIAPGAPMRPMVIDMLAIASTRKYCPASVGPSIFAATSVSISWKMPPDALNRNAIDEPLSMSRKICLE